MFNPKAHLPQYGYFRASYKIPLGNNEGWTITGHSRALERTGFWIPELRVMLDAGVDLPTGSGARPLAICVTHGHIDHCNALPVLLRHCEGNPPVHVLAPSPIIHRLRSFTQLSWAVKVDIQDDLPDAYQPPSENDRMPLGGTVWQADDYQRWVPCDADAKTSITLPCLGKKAKTPIVIHCLQLFHKRCSAVGYLLATPSRTVKKVRPELIGATKQETGQNVRDAKARGEAFQIQEVIPETPLLAFVLDTMIEALMEEHSSTARQILECPVVMIECTYLEKSMTGEARNRGHICWFELLPFVARSAARRRQEQDGFHQTWILVHFSLRYLDEHIAAFFEDEQQCKMRMLPPVVDDEGGDRNERLLPPPDIVLWLDGGPKEFWVDEALE